MKRYQPGHVPDLCRPADGLQRCSCGFLAVSLDAVRAHACNPQPDVVPRPPVRLPVPEWCTVHTARPWNVLRCRCGHPKDTHHRGAVKNCRECGCCRYQPTDAKVMAA